MTRKEVKELLPIIKAFCDGKTIQHLDIIKDKWEDIDEFVYHGSVKSYRIKPEPFKDAKEFVKEMTDRGYDVRTMKFEISPKLPNYERFNGLSEKYYGKKK